ncbi:MAG: hypothetical protein ACU0C9_08485 [Paracoccaceae bacterium]
MLPENCFFLDRLGCRNVKTSSLFGYALFEDAIVYGTHGLKEYYKRHSEPKIPIDGRFVGIFIDSNEITIRADRTGQEMLYLYKDGADWAVSNSFMLLAAEVARTHRITLYEPAVIGFHLKNGVHIGEQLISQRSMVTEIEIVPLTSDIVINRKSGDLKISDHAFDNIYEMAGMAYHEKLLDFLERSAGYLSALLSTGVPTQMFLSGGYDSRLVLGLLLAGGQRDNVQVTSHPHKSNDYNIAKSICQLLNLPLNNSRRDRHGLLSAGDAFRMWMLSCGGTYLPIYPVRNVTLLPDAEIRLTGDQPAGWSYFAGNAPFNGTAQKISDDILSALKNRPHAQQVRDDFLGVFDRHGIDPLHPKAMLAHYSAVRSRHHCGRAWYKSLGNEQLFTPLMLSDMIALNFHPDVMLHSDIRFFADAFSAIGGWVLEQPFETPDRQFPKEMLENSPFKGGATITPRNVSVFGFAQSNAAVNPDLMSVPVNLSFQEKNFKNHLSAGLWRTTHTRNSRLFCPEDFAAANREIVSDGSLSHGFRKLSHIVMTETVMEIIENSGSH